MPVEVVVPPLGTNVDTLTLLTWYKQEGEMVDKDEPLFAVETDKATLDVESPATGILRMVTAAPGAEVMSLSRIAVIVAPGETDEPAAVEPETSNLSAAIASIPEGATSIRTPAKIGNDRPRIAPRAKRLAEEHNIDWTTLRGTGPEGAIVERDVLLMVGGQQDADHRAGDEQV